MVASPADVIWVDLGFVTRSCPTNSGMRDEPLITSAAKASIMGDSKKVNMVERAIVNPRRNSVATK